MAPTCRGGLLELWPSYPAYALTFLLIVQVWANHHAMFDHIRAADWILLLGNVLLLMAVGFLPFSASVLAESLRDHAGQRTAVVFYGASFALGSVFSSTSGAMPGGPATGQGH